MLTTLRNILGNIRKREKRAKETEEERERRRYKRRIADRIKRARKRSELFMKNHVNENSGASCLHNQVQLPPRVPNIDIDAFEEITTQVLKEARMPPHVPNIDIDAFEEITTQALKEARMPPRVPDIDTDAFEEITTQTLKGHVPVSLPLIGSFSADKCINISGKVDNDPSRFAINLQCGEGPDEDIALHINPRWDDFEGSVLVFNSREADAWGEELRKPNPIVAGEEVDIYIIGCSEGFSILVNGEMVEEVEHRMDISRITHVSLEGSIMLYRVLVN